MRFTICIQTRPSAEQPWITRERTNNPRQAAGMSQRLAREGAAPCVRVIDVHGRVRVEYDHGERVDRTVQSPGGARRIDQDRAIVQKLNAEDRRLEELRARHQNQVRTVVVDGVEFESIWDGRGSLPGYGGDGWSL